jgi:hypothetical protein
MNFTFVHIPKNGGTAFETWIRYHASRGGCPRVSGFGHENDVATVERKGGVAIVIIREPVERLLSAFLFWKHGTPLFPVSPHGRRTSATHKLFASEAPKVSFNFSEFVEAWADEAHQHHAYVSAITTGPPCNWQNKCLGFSEQTAWVDGWTGDERTVHWICYRSGGLGSKLATVLTEQRAGCSSHSLKLLANFDQHRINPSQQDDPGTSTLSARALAFVRARYARDLYLHDTLCRGHRGSPSGSPPLPKPPSQSAPLAKTAASATQGKGLAAKKRSSHAAWVWPWGGS